MAFQPHVRSMHECRTQDRNMRKMDLIPCRDERVTVGYERRESSSVACTDLPLFLWFSPSFSSSLLLCVETALHLRVSDNQRVVFSLIDDVFRWSLPAQAFFLGTEVRSKGGCPRSMDERRDTCPSPTIRRSWIGVELDFGPDAGTAVVLQRAHPHITTQRYRSTSRFASYQRRYWHGPHAQSRDHSRDCNLLCSWSRSWRRALWPVRCHRGHIACTVIRFLPRSCLSHINQRIAVSTPVCADLSRRYIGVGHALIRQSRCRVHVTDIPPFALWSNAFVCIGSPTHRLIVIVNEASAHWLPRR